MKLVIDYENWCQGVHCRSDGHMCAIGHYVHALGVSKDNLKTGGSHREEWPKEAHWLLVVDDQGVDMSAAWGRIADANDSPPPNFDIIRREFAEHGVEVEFVNFPVPFVRP